MSNGTGAWRQVSRGVAAAVILSLCVLVAVDALEVLHPIEELGPSCNLRVQGEECERVHPSELSLVGWDCPEKPFHHNFHFCIHTLFGAVTPELPVTRIELPRSRTRLAASTEQVVLPLASPSLRGPPFFLI